MKTLVCFTASFPYGNKETYFENELEYLSRAFETIIIIPSYNPYLGIRRNCPENVLVYEPILKQGVPRVIEGLRDFCFSKEIFKEFCKEKVFLKGVKFKKWFNNLISFGTGLKKFNSYNFDPDEVILYSYWAGKNFFIHSKLERYRKVIRMHGGDFYEERNYGYLPTRFELYRSADLLLPISKDIKNILIEKFKISSSTISLSYLGTVSPNLLNPNKLKGSKIRIVSCSNVYALKRVELIFEILKSIALDIEWIHIGEGPTFQNLQELVQNNLSDFLTVNLVGFKTQQQIREIYSQEHFDFFINTSEYEGLPVSIMEAFSFGIPTIATDVGGTSEIVNETNGMLINKDFVPAIVAHDIVRLLNGNMEALRENAFLTWEQSFNADVNYTNLIRELKKL